VEQISLAQRAAAAASEKASREADWQVEQRQRILTEIEDGQSQLTGVQAEIQDLEASLSPARESVQEHIEQAARLPLVELQSEVGLWNTRAAVAERLAAEAGTRCNDRQDAAENAQSQLEAARQRLEQTAAALIALEQEKEQQRQEEVLLSAEIAELRLQIDPAEAELDTMEEAQAILQGSDTAARQTLSAAEARHAQARINLARRQESLETWRRRIEDDFGLVAFDYADDVSGQTPLPLGELVEDLPWVEQLNVDLEENVRRQRAQLRRMGPVNPEAQAEFQEVKERFAFMTAQVSDLEKAEEDVRQVIKELDELMEIELRKTFDQVAGEFGGIFKRLFGGGSARLMLTDPDDMTNTGIDIEARLPGRRMQGLSLLSGGERSLTAVSLIFALLKVSPTPFCVLDEVDAMLDEANVGRFRELLSELSADTQFVIVTHNRNTVQVADVIYGVTMGRDSTSQVISLKLDQVSEIVE
jgi:chromosome segregation protein